MKGRNRLHQPRFTGDNTFYSQRCLLGHDLERGFCKLFASPRWSSEIPAIGTTCLGASLDTRKVLIILVDQFGPQEKHHRCLPPASVDIVLEQPSLCLVQRSRQIDRDSIDEFSLQKTDGESAGEVVHMDTAFP